MTNEMYHTIASTFIIVLGAIFTRERIIKIGNYIQRKLRPHDVITMVKIQNTLDELRSKVRAERITLWMYNNGQTSVNGYSYKYASPIFESYNVLRSRSMKAERSNTPVEDYLDVVAMIQNSKKFCVFTENSSSPIVRAHHDMMGFKCSVEYKFVDKDVYQGFISVAFSTKTEPTECDIKMIANSAALINREIKHIKR